MQTWLIVVLYVLVALVYAALQQVFFRFRFRELAFTFGFLTFVSFVVMIATKFSDLFVWITVANVALEAAVGVYVMIVMRKMREKVMRQIQQPNMEDMFKNLFAGGNVFGGMPDIFGAGAKQDDKAEQPDIIVTEEKGEGGSAPDDDPARYEVGDVIVDDEEKKNDDNDAQNK